MNWDEPEKRPKANQPLKLDEWSIDELKSYIDSLRSEIERAEGLIAQKQVHLAGAQQIFKKQNKT